MRKPISVSTCLDESNIYATVICDDGSIWGMNHIGKWKRIPDIPQPEVSEIVGKIVGVCKDCGRMITEEQDWHYSALGEGWMAHALEEDCIKNGNEPERLQKATEESPTTKKEDKEET